MISIKMQKTCFLTNMTHKIIALVNRNFKYKSLSYFAIQLVFVLLLHYTGLL